MNAGTIKENNYYLIKQKEDISALKLAWKKNGMLGISEFKEGIIEFAQSCKNYEIIRAIIDARQLDPNGGPYGWVSGQRKIDGLEEYNSWWRREIAPIFNDAQIVGLGVATGDPNAPGEIPQTPEGVNFKIAYFTNLEDVLEWKLD